jgi:galactokinase
MTAAKLSEEFQRHYHIAAELVAYAPGRVNLIGDHTDYNDGFVLPAAINFGTYVVCTRRDDRQVTIIAKEYAEQRVSFNLDELSKDVPVEYPSWSKYVLGALLALKNQGADISGADLLVSGDVPQGAGLSSSASFEIAIIKAFTQLYQLNIGGIDAAKMGQWAEHNVVGCNCGIMDQLISALGQKDHAMLLDCRTLDYQFAYIPADWSIVIVNSNVKRGLVDSEYNDRRLQCEAAAQFFGKASLRELSLATLQAAANDLSPLLFKRARHVLSENLRTESALAALKTRDMATLSILMAQSHQSLKDDFEVTTSEIDILVDLIAATLGKQGGVRMTGGGFGGCVVALMPASLVTTVSAVITSGYFAATGLSADIYVCSAENGAFNQPNPVHQ